MRDIRTLFGDYANYHQTKGNKWFHRFGIPLIMLTLLGMLARVPIAPHVDLAILLVVVSEIVYAILDCRLVKRVLEREGYRVQEAVDGVDAVLKLGLVEYDVIILDMMMPNLDGFAFMTTLADHDSSRLKKIIVTSAASPALIRKRMSG